MSDDERSPLLSQSNQIETEKPSDFFSPKRNFFRYTGLFFICFITFGPYFCYVLPGALEQEIERDLSVTTTQFTVFTSLYSWPNVFLCFFGGYLIDKVFGVRLGGIIFSTLITVGIFLFGFGAYIDAVLIMDIGRFVFGMGGECVAIVQKAYTVTWFSKDEMNLVFGLLTSGALLGASSNQILMGPIYKFIAQYETGYRCLGLTILLAAVTCAFSTICTIVVAYMDTVRKRHLKQQALKEANETKQIKPKINLKDALYFPIELWLIIIICVVFYSATFPFISLAKLFLIRKYESSSELASVQQSLFFLVTTIFSPIFGYLVDKTGCNTLWVVISAIIAILSHFLMLFTFINSFVPVITLAISLAILATALWPMVSDLVPNHQLGTAYGLMQSIQNLALASFSLISGYLVQNYGYMVMEVFFLCLCNIGLVAALLLYLIDKSRNGLLGKTAHERSLSVN